jgi:peptidoglycan/LPS O-acetylase OafA/YrhL
MTAAATLDAPPALRRRFELFGALRGIAVVAVLVFHVASITGAVTGSVTGRLAVLFGNLGVLVFFVISGFLLYRPFVAARVAGEELPNLRRFARRRVLRIVPPYWTALTLLAVFPGIIGVFSGDAWRFYGFLQLYSDEHLGQGIPPAWTLCVEVTYYLLLPVWVLALRRARLRWDLAALAVAALIGVVVQVLAARQQIPRVWADALPGQLPWFALGMALAIWSVAAGDREPGLVVRRPLLCWAVAAAALVVMVATSRGGTLAEIAAALAAPAQVLPLLRRIVLSAVLAVALLLPAVFGEHAGGLPRRVLAAAPVAFLGAISYSLYLYHLTVAEWLWSEQDPGHFSSGGLGLAGHLGGAPTPVMLALTLAVAGAVAAVSYRFIERPFITGAGRAATAAGSASRRA